VFFVVCARVRARVRARVCSLLFLCDFARARGGSRARACVLARVCNEQSNSLNSSPSGENQVDVLPPVSNVVQVWPGFISLREQARARF
jgi:hypothetical protein